MNKKSTFIMSIILLCAMLMSMKGYTVNANSGKISLNSNYDLSSLDEYQSPAIEGNLPVFYQDLKNDLDFPLSYLSQKNKSFSKWQKKARKKVEELAFFKKDYSAYNPEVIDEIDRGDYTAKKVVFNITKESRVMALMLVPKGEGPFPAVLLLHDHGAKFDIGKEKMIQTWNDEEKEVSSNAWSEKYFSGQFVGDELAKRGYVVLATDALGWGDRGGMDYEGQQAVASNLLNLGNSYGGVIAFEDVRAADFLSKLQIVDEDNVASFGFSMGAFRSWQVAALSNDIKASVSICWMATLEGLMVPGNNQLRGQSSFTMLHPGLANYLDYPDVASISAPKPALFFDGEEDGLFPAESVQDAFDKMEKVWVSQNAGDKFKAKLWPGLGHTCVKEMQDEAYEWMDKWLKG